MFGTVVECGNSLEQHLNKLAAAKKEIEIRNVFAKFTTNVIVSVAFGIEINCFENPDNEFIKYGWRWFEPKYKHVIRFTMSLLSPFLTKLFGVRFADKDVELFMKDTVRQTLEFREKHNISRKDFFQLLMQLRNTGKVYDDNDDWTTKTTSEEKLLSLDDMAAQAYVFFIAGAKFEYLNFKAVIIIIKNPLGYESSSTTMSFCMYELAKSPEIQQRVYEEIENVLQKHNGKLTYESLNEMKYLDNCIDGIF